MATAARTIALVPQYARAAALARRDHAAFDDLQRFCLFVGYPRSGHSIVGALVDAHPDAVLANELDVLRYVRAGFTRRQLFALLLDSSRTSGEGGRRSTDGRYDYAVPGQWQGRFRRLRVIGDKRAGNTARRLAARPRLFEDLRRRVGLPVQVLHVMRNPFDTITTMVERGQASDLEAAAEQYVVLCRAVERLRAGVDDRDWLDVRHEDFVADPAGRLEVICGALGLEPDAGYVADCASIVFDAPRPTRERGQWTPGLVDAVTAQAAAFPYLAGYRFDE